MRKENEKLRHEFTTLFKEWEQVIQDPKIQLSSRPKDYLNNKPYLRIVELGKDVLPFVIEKLQEGVFFFNQAVLDIMGVKIEEIIGKEKRFLSEQEKSKLIVRWWQSKTR